MKHFLLLFAVISLLSLNSCNKDDDSSDDTQQAASNITVTIDGESLNFNTVTVNTYTVDDISYHEVTAIIGSDTSKIFNFDVVAGSTGSNAIEDFNFSDGSDDFFDYQDALNSIITVNDGETIEGNFSGEIQAFDGNGGLITRMLSNGTIEINY